MLLGVFFAVERRTESPLINVHIFANRAFSVENVILGIAMMAFIPVFFFASIYGQIALAEKATTASLLILYFFLGFVVCAQIGGRMLDRIGAKRPVVLGCALAAVGFALWAGKATDLHAGAQVIYIVMAGAGMGLMLGQANTDAINRASRYSYGEATGITQTVRNYGASLGFAILGTILITEFRSRITSSLTARGLPGPAASAEAAKIAQLQGGNGNVATIPPFIRADFAGATRDVLYVMAVIMAVAALVALRGLRRGVQQETEQSAADVGAQSPGEDPDADFYSGPALGEQARRLRREVALREQAVQRLEQLGVRRRSRRRPGVRARPAAPARSSRGRRRWCRRRGPPPRTCTSGARAPRGRSPPGAAGRAGPRGSRRSPGRRPPPATGWPPLPRTPAGPASAPARPGTPPCR